VQMYIFIGKHKNILKHLNLQLEFKKNKEIE
jgi:hypothetical protein